MRSVHDRKTTPSSAERLLAQPAGWENPEIPQDLGAEFLTRQHPTGHPTSQTLKPFGGETAMPKIWENTVRKVALCKARLRAWLRVIEEEILGPRRPEWRSW